MLETIPQLAWNRKKKGGKSSPSAAVHLAPNFTTFTLCSVLQSIEPLTSLREGKQHVWHSSTHSAQTIPHSRGGGQKEGTAIGGQGQPANIGPGGKPFFGSAQGKGGDPLGGILTRQRGRGKSIQAAGWPPPFGRPLVLPAP